jgi:hypothetical protein
LEEVDIESDEAGMQRTLFSETRAAEVQCDIMNPFSSPPCYVKKGGNPILYLLLIIFSYLLSLKFAN